LTASGLPIKPVPRKLIGAGGCKFMVAERLLYLDRGSIGMN
jgi:hypothetical protein